MKLGAKLYFDTDIEDKTIISRHPASDGAVGVVLSTPIGDDNTRSEWLWIRLANGNLILGCYPQGSTYEAVKDDAYCKI